MKLMVGVVLGFFFASTVWADSKPDTAHLWVTRRADDPRFVVSMARMYKCQLRDLGTMTKYDALRVPAELYPKESLRLHEEGTVMLELLFDDDWCVRKATVLESSGFFRLDEVSLQYALQLRFHFEVKDRVDGQPMVRLPIAWGAGQWGRSKELVKKYSNGEAGK
jgi:hypothetical protein